MNQSRLDWQTTIVLIAAILVFGGGTMALLIAGTLAAGVKDTTQFIPGALWAIDGALANAIVGTNGFFTMRQMHAASLWHLAQAVPVRPTDTVTVAPDATTGTTGTTS